MATSSEPNTDLECISLKSTESGGEKPKMGVGEAKTGALQLGSLSCEIPLALYFILPLSGQN